MLSSAVAIEAMIPHTSRDERINVNINTTPNNAKIIFATDDENLR